MQVPVHCKRLLRIRLICMLLHSAEYIANVCLVLYEYMHEAYTIKTQIERRNSKCSFMRIAGHTVSVIVLKVKVLVDNAANVLIVIA